jgi:hypothetical protein
MFRVNQMVGFWARYGQEDCTLTIVPRYVGASSTDLVRADDLFAPGYLVNEVSVPNSGVMWARHITAVQNIALFDLATGTILEEYTASQFSSSFPAQESLSPIGVGPAPDNYGYVFYDNGGKIYRLHESNGTIDHVVIEHGASGGLLTNGICVDPNGTNIWGIYGPASGVSVIAKMAPNWGTNVANETLSSTHPFLRQFARNALAISGRIYVLGGTNDDEIAWADTSTLAITEVISDGGTARSVVIGNDGNIYSKDTGGGGVTLRKHDQDGSLIDSLVFNTLTAVALYDSNGYLWVQGSLVAAADSFIRVDPATMTVVDSVLRDDGTNIYQDIIGEYSPGVPICHVPPGSDSDFGALATIECL